MPVVVFHGTADHNNPYEGVPRPDGSTDLSLPPSLPGSPPVPDVTAAWAARNGCSNKTSDTPIGSDVHVVRYKCPRDAEVELYRIDGGGHTWPGVPVPGEYASIVGPATTTISANARIWKFFLHATPNGFFDTPLDDPSAGFGPESVEVHAASTR